MFFQMPFTREFVVFKYIRAVSSLSIYIFKISLFVYTVAPECKHCTIINKSYWSVQMRLDFVVKLQC